MAKKKTNQRTNWLLHTPVRALRALAERIPKNGQTAWLTKQEIRFSKPEAVLKRLTTEQLIEMINAFPKEIPDSEVEALFKEYRHGRSPTVHLYTILHAPLENFDLSQANKQLQRAVKRANTILLQEARQEGVQPRLQNLVIEPLDDLGQDWPGGLHACYHCQSRMDYIATDETATSGYQLLYGHLWVDLQRAFAAIHVHPAVMEPILASALSRALDARLSPVRVDKELKNELRFLRQASCRRARLVDPSPTRERFRSLTLADDEDLEKRRYLGWNYKDWENDFPEMASARYYAKFIGNRQTSLSIGTRRGSITLSGAVAASELGVWAYGTGHQIVSTWRARQERYFNKPLAAIDYGQLWEDALLRPFQEELRQPVVALVQALATIKERKDRLFHTWPLPMTALALAETSARANAQEALGEAVNTGGPAPWFQIMVRTECPVDGCTSAAEYLTCPSCGRALFTLATSDADERVLACVNPRCRGRWVGCFPLQTECEDEHPFQLNWDEQMEGRLELFVGEELASLVERLLTDKADVYRFNATRESLWVREGDLVHQHVNPARVIREAGEMHIDTGGGAVIWGDTYVEGDFAGRDKIVSATFSQAADVMKEVEPARKARRNLEAALKTVQDQIAQGETANLELLEEALSILANQDPRVIEAILTAVLHPATQATPSIKALAKDTLAEPSKE
ncbi:MAG: hypothetical protein AB8I69_02610 [Anaerolineae bacterium]|jgi:hypothetical protein